ncbi:MAG: response regulator [Pseudomonadota bacterium]
MSKINRAILIDDEKFDQMAYRRLMNGMPEIGEIVSFHYADDALDHLKENTQTDGDVIFLDINMPRMNGFEFLEAANREFGEGFNASVIVMLTTSLNPSDVSRASEYGSVKAFINKPLTRTHIRDVCTMLDPRSV